MMKAVCFTFALVLLVNIADANVSPVANFEADPQTGLGILNVGFDATSSADSDGSIVSYIWNGLVGRDSVSEQEPLWHMIPMRKT